MTKADKAILDELPEGVTGAQLLRQAIMLYRLHGEECTHPDLTVVCPDCGYRSKAPNPDEDPAVTGSGSDGDTKPARGKKPQVSRV